MPQLGHESVLGQHPQGPLRLGIHDHGVARLPLEDERDHTVVACGRAGHHAFGAVDLHDLSMAAG
jgi:hypothetical protein